MKNLSDIVTTIAGDLKPNPKRVDKAHERAEKFVKALSKASDKRFKLRGAREIGSLTRNTAVLNKADYDVLVIFKQSPLMKGNSELLAAKGTIERLRKHVKRLRKGPISRGLISVRGQGHSVGIIYSGKNNVRIDLVPAIEVSRGAFLIPERSTNKWIATTPDRMVVWQKQQQLAQPNLRAIIRLMKGFVKARGGNLKFPGYALELWVTSQAEKYAGMNSLDMIEALFSQVGRNWKRQHLALLGKRDWTAKVTVVDPITNVNGAGNVTSTQRSLFIEKCRWATKQIEKAKRQHRLRQSKRAEATLRKLFIGGIV